MAILGFNPAAPTNTPGIVTACQNFIPCDGGMEAAPSASDMGLDALPAACTGAFTGTNLAGTVRVVAGTGTKLYELSGTSWTDRSVSGGYTAGSEWTFCQFGDYTLATNRTEAIQASSSGAFTNITGPKAKIIESVVTGAGGFVMAFNTDTSADQWQCSALNDHTDWTDDVATQSASGRLIGAGGAINAAKAFGSDSIVVYKANVAFHGRYVGGDVVWQWSEIPEIGCVGKRAVADIGGMSHFVVGSDGFWVYDGARPQRVGTEVREWFGNALDYTYADKTEVRFDQASNRVFIFFRKRSQGSVSSCLVWHVGTNQWGLLDQQIETTLRYITPGVTYAADPGTFDDGSTDSFDSGPTNRKLLGVFNSSHKLCTLIGAPSVSWFQTADLGDVSKASRLTEANVSFSIRPASASCRPYSSASLGGTELVASSESAYDSSGSMGRFTVRQHARWHRLEFTFTGPVRVTDYGATIAPTGSR